MRSLVYFVALSIDGKIAGPNEEIEFYPTSQEYMDWMTTRFSDAIPAHIRDQLRLDQHPHRNFDTIVMGRKTYDPALRMGITSPYSHLRQYVFSRSLDQIDPTVEVVSTDPVAKVQQLKSEDSDLDIYLAGGGEIAGRLLGEIDKLVIKYYPVVAGAGYDGFGSAFNPTYFNLTEVKTFDGGNTVLYYDAQR